MDGYTEVLGGGCLTSSWRWRAPQVILKFTEESYVFFPQTVSRASASGFALRSELGRRREFRKRTKGISSLSPVFNKGEWITLWIYIPETHSRILAWRVPMDRGAWRAKSPWGHKESDATERLSTHPCTHTSLQQSGRQHSWCPSAESIHGNPPSCLDGASSRFPFRGPTWASLPPLIQVNTAPQSHDRRKQTASRHRVRKI